MSAKPAHAPIAIPQVMISSTFTDLKEHRAALIEALLKYKLFPNGMEFDEAKVGYDVIDSSLQMVRESAAYILVIGFKYGQIPKDDHRNPDGLSITELEFDEAQSLGRPTLLFIMGDTHPIQKSNVETNTMKKRKLTSFCNRAKKSDAESSVNRVYSVFNSLEEFKEKLGSSLNDLCGILKSVDPVPFSNAQPSNSPSSIHRDVDRAALGCSVRCSPRIRRILTLFLPGNEDAIYRTLKRYRAIALEIQRYSDDAIQKVIDSCTFHEEREAGVQKKSRVKPYVDLDIVVNHNIFFDRLVAALTWKIHATFKGTRDYPDKLLAASSECLPIHQEVANRLGMELVILRVDASGGFEFEGSKIRAKENLAILHDVIVTCDTLAKCAAKIRNHGGKVNHVFAIVIHNIEQEDAIATATTNSLLLNSLCELTNQDE